MTTWHHTSTETGSSNSASYEFRDGVFYFNLGRVIAPAPKIPCAHKLLGVGCDAAPDEIKRGYRKLAKMFHPDLGPPEEKAQRERRMKLINRAYEYLKGTS